MWFWKKLLAVAFTKVYDSPEGREELRNAINAETWFGSQIETGGHALSNCVPLGDYEIISLKCVLTGNKSMQNNVVSTRKLDYWLHIWK